MAIIQVLEKSQIATIIEGELRGTELRGTEEKTDYNTHLGLLNPEGYQSLGPGGVIKCTGSFAGDIHLEDTRRILF